MKLILIFIAFLNFPLNLLCDFSLDYSLSGDVYYNGVLLKNCSIDFYEYPSAAWKKSIQVDKYGKYSCTISASGPCPIWEFGRGKDIQYNKLTSKINKMNSDSIVFYHNGARFKLRNMADSVIYDYIIKHNNLEYIEENEKIEYHSLTFDKDIHFLGR